MRRLARGPRRRRGLPAQSVADVALKIRTAVACEGDIKQTAENGCNSAMAIVAALADLDRLAATAEPAPAG